MNTNEGIPEPAGKLSSNRITINGRASLASAGAAPPPHETPVTRNGVPILPISKDGRRVTPEVVDRLRDEI